MSNEIMQSFYSKENKNKQLRKFYSYCFIHRLVSNINKCLVGLGFMKVVKFHNLLLVFLELHTCYSCIHKNHIGSHQRK